MDAIKCSCGAITVTLEDGEYSMTSETFDKTFPNHYSGDVEEGYCNCNHCVNHWGIDLCGCGCGEPFGECQEENVEGSNRPAQSMEDHVLGCYCSGGIV
jgi:hypothetical protein